MLIGVVDILCRFVEIHVHIVYWKCYFFRLDPVFQTVISIFTKTKFCFPYHCYIKLFILVSLAYPMDYFFQNTQHFSKHIFTKGGFSALCCSENSISSKQTRGFCNFDIVWTFQFSCLEFWFQVIWWRWF